MNMKLKLGMKGELMMQSIINMKKFFEEGIVLVIFSALMLSFIFLGFIVVERNVIDIMGTYENPGVIYFQQTQSVQNDLTAQHAVQVKDDSVVETTVTVKESNHVKNDINDLAHTLERKLESKAKVLIIWFIEKSTQALEYIIYILSKSLQSS
ncbi:hypothetical protein BHU72_11370 [Desulfuribacillus stibiiarsenatis]|uniref:Uncharacterized protein n=2 Tax=Desulfuribacillus stibiiarsenatis TaxID=1390249 RepID=A0A1E5L863_9FIRM|nr:hypothetical protein BHU72_11370 [Desulfuribacillus stibiiarsenatis]